VFKLDSKLGLGLAALGRPGYITLGHHQNIGEDKSIDNMRNQCHRVLDFAYEKGIRYFDVARVYGESEEFLSSWIRKQNQFAGFVGSKWGYEYLAEWSVGTEQHERKDHSHSFLKKQWVETRMNLGKSIDLYQIHSVTPESSVLKDKAVIQELHALKKGGVDIGISTSGPQQKETITELLEINKTEKLFTFIQCTINIFEQSCLEILEKASNQGINVIAKEIFANGRLTDLNDSLHQEKFSEMKKVTSTFNMKIEDLALIWVYQLPFVKIVLTGASTIDQLDKNINSLNKIDIELPSFKNYQLSLKDYWNTRKSLSWN
jgi:aryl-alcohol dehydrogenase-like predicted oxidoreductase